MAGGKKGVLWKFLDLLKNERSEIISIYFYAILSGLVQLSLPLGIQSIISFMMGGAISTSLVLLIILVILGVLLAGLLQVNQMKLTEKIQQQLFVRYSFEYAESIPKFDLKAVNNYYLPELVNRFSDTVSLQKGISKLLLDIPASTIQILFGLILLSLYHPFFIMFSVSLIFVLYLILYFTAGRGLNTSIEESNYKYKVMGYLEELARAISSLKFSHDDTRHLHRTDKFVTGYLNARTAHFRILLVQYWTLIIFKVLITAAMLIAGAFLLVHQQLNIGQFIAAEIVIITVIGSVEKLIVNLDKVYDVMTSLDKITKVTEQPEEHSGAIVLSGFESGLPISINSVGFGYATGNNVIRELSLSVAAGEKVCIQGPPGAGKTTLLQLIAGLYHPDSGSLLAGSTAVQNYEVSSFRRSVGLLATRQELFDGSIFENICIGNERTSYEQLDKLAAIVGLKKYIEGLPLGYEQHIMPAGHKLPASVAKQILLLRAVSGSPRLLLLDDPLNDLDENSAEAVRRLLLDGMPGTTIIMVSKDARLAEGCNRIITLDKGEIKSVKQGK